MPSLSLQPLRHTNFDESLGPFIRRPPGLSGHIPICCPLLCSLRFSKHLDETLLRKNLTYLNNSTNPHQHILQNLLLTTNNDTILPKPLQFVNAVRCDHLARASLDASTTARRPESLALGASAPMAFSGIGLYVQATSFGPNPSSRK